MIVSLRGTNGSGKSYLVQRLMKRYQTSVESRDTRGRPATYKIVLNNGEPLYLIGPYETPCGGCDAIHPYDDIWPRVDRLAKQGDVLFEGSLVSSGYGRIGIASEEYGEDVLFAFMNTPLEKCIAHVMERRKARGNERPLNPKNIIQKFRAVELSVSNIGIKHGRRIFIVDYRKALSQMLGIFYRTLDLASRSDPHLFPKTSDFHR